MATNKDRNCQECEEKDEYDDMVCCDLCQKWVHFCCAGVKSDIKNKHWNCKRCEVKNERPKNSEIHVLQESIKNLSATVQTIQTAIAKPEAVPETLSGRSLTKNIDRENDRTKPNTTVQKGATTYALTKILPCKTLEALDDFLLKVLDDESLYRGLVSYIESFLGNDIRKSIKIALDLIIDKSVQNKLTWTGLRTTKPSFEKGYRPIINAMDEALKQKFKDYEYAILSKKIQTLLQSS